MREETKKFVNAANTAGPLSSFYLRLRKEMMAEFDSDIVLGEKYRDTLSNFEGVATGCTFFLHGCERVILESWNEIKAEINTEMFDAPRLEHLESGELVTARDTGGWKDAATKTEGALK